MNHARELEKPDDRHRHDADTRYRQNGHKAVDSLGLYHSTNTADGQSQTNAERESSTHFLTSSVLQKLQLQPSKPTGHIKINEAQTAKKQEKAKYHLFFWLLTMCGAVEDCPDATNQKNYSKQSGCHVHTAHSLLIL